MRDLAVCGLPGDLHPVSQVFLNYYLDGVMSFGEFLRAFSLPNSDYISIAECIVNRISWFGLV